MRECIHLNENSDFNRWRDLTESIRLKVPGAYIRLYNEFGRGLELLMRRQVPPTRLGVVIDKILGEVMLAIENRAHFRPDLLPALVRSTARRLIPTSTPRAEPEVNALANEALERILQQLPGNQRKALEMVYVDGTDDQTVCARMRLTIKELAVIKHSTLERFTMAAAGEQSRGMSQ